MAQATMRLAIPTDLSAIEALVEAAYRPWADRIGVIPGPMQDDYAGAIALGHVRVLESQGRIAAILVLIPQDDALLLENVAVHPDAQGKGFGRRLLSVAERVARDGGHDRLRLYTHEKMHENIALYANLGFGETRRVTEKGLARVYMEKRL